MVDSAKPPRRFTELSDETRAFIAMLDADDWATLLRVIALFRSVQGWCRVNRWLFFSVLAVLIAIVHFFAELQKLIPSFGKH